MRVCEIRKPTEVFSTILLEKKDSLVFKGHSDECRPGDLLYIWEYNVEKKDFTGDLIKAVIRTSKNGYEINGVQSGLVFVEFDFPVHTKNNKLNLGGQG